MDRKIKIGIREARKEMGISEVELASKLKIETSVLIGWEVGAAFPSINIIKSLSFILNKSIENLIFSENREPLDISGLSDTEKEWLIDFYQEIIKSN